VTDASPSCIPTLREALSRYLLEITPQKKGKLQESRRIHAWQKHPLGDLPLDRIRPIDLVSYRNNRLAAGRSVYTIRLDLAVLSHLFEIARTEWGHETLGNPVKALRLPAFPPGRDRRLEPGELGKILSLSTQVMKDLIRFAIETAMRRSEILSLTWDRIDLEKRVATIAETKSGGKRKVPLSPLALEILQKRLSENQGRPFPLSPDDVSHRFLDACRSAGIRDLRFHDLRHEATSRFFEKGLSVPQVAAITGHKTLQMLHRYTHLRAEDLALKLEECSGPPPKRE
jgi:integrase